MWINTTTLGEFVLHADIRHELWKSGKEAPGVLTNEYLASVGYAVLTPEKPDYDSTAEYLSPRGSSLVNEVWVKQYDVKCLDPVIVANRCFGSSLISPKAAAILQAAGLYDVEKVTKWKSIGIRNTRNSLIAETDWTQCADIDQATKDKWAPYRKALRDVPQQAGFPFDVIWPT